MLRNGRGVDNDFRAHHWLYRRCVKEDVQGDQLLPARISYDDASVNWSKYSWPWDVIFDHPGQGVARWVVDDLPHDLPENPPPKTNVEMHDFRPKHVPLDENYSHSEIQVYRSGQPLQRLSSNLVKKEYRTIMGERSLVLIQPQV